jgi:predicted tellurium resistance membrane protein TerC
LEIAIEIWFLISLPTVSADPFTFEAILGFICLLALLIFLSAPAAGKSLDRLSVAGNKSTAPFLVLNAVQLFIRVMMIALATWVTQSRFGVTRIFGDTVSVRECALLAMGFYLLSRSVMLLNESSRAQDVSTPQSLGGAIIQSIPLALDTSLVAFGMTDFPAVMVASVFALMLILSLSGRKLADALRRRPVLFTLSLGFVILISLLLVVNGVAGDALRISKTYLYFVVAFGFAVQLLAIRRRGNRQLL